MWEKRKVDRVRVSGKTLRVKGEGGRGKGLQPFHFNRRDWRK